MALIDELWQNLTQLGDDCWLPLLEAIGLDLSANDRVAAPDDAESSAKHWL